MLIAQAALLEQLRQDRSAADPHLEFVRREAHPAQNAHGRADDLGFGHDRRLADDIHVPLVVLALAPARHPLVAETLRDGRPLEGETERPLPRHDHPRQRRGQLGPQGQPPAALVLERVNLFAYLFAGLALEQLHRLDDRRVIHLETPKPRRLAPSGEKRLASTKVFRIKVAHPARRSKSFHQFISPLGISSHRGHRVHREVLIPEQIAYL